MPERRYTVAEIDEMRRWVGGLTTTIGLSEDARARVIEDRLRTYMLNGTTPAELHAEFDAELTRDLAYAAESAERRWPGDAEKRDAFVKMIEQRRAA
jgi:hypothetical protein